MGHPVDEPDNVPESVEKIEDLQLIVVESGDSNLMRIHNELICAPNIHWETNGSSDASFDI